MQYSKLAGGERRKILPRFPSLWTIGAHVHKSHAQVLSLVGKACFDYAPRVCGLRL